MPDPSAAVNRFYAGLAAVQPDDWLRIAISPPIDDYQVASESAVSAISAFTNQSDDRVAANLLHLVQQEAGEIATGFIPDLEALRAAMRPPARPGAPELTPEGYQVLMREAARRVFVAACGIALGEHLSSPDLAALYQPFEGFIPLSAVLDPRPDFVRDIALALLTSSRWAVEKGPGTPEEKTAYWETFFPLWMYEFNGGEMAGIGVPNMEIGRALVRAATALLPGGEGKDIRYEAERRVQIDSDEQIEELLGERRWIMRRQARRWIVSRMVRVLEAMLTREASDGTKTVDPSPASLGVIDRTLKAMGFEAADREPPAPPGGTLTVPEAFTWWRPSPVRFASGSRSLGTTPDQLTASAVTPPDAHGMNITLMMEPDHFNPAWEWYLASVLPFIDDYSPGPKSADFPDIGRSRFSAAVPYRRQPEELRLFLWALADGMQVAAQTREVNGGDSRSLRLSRLPLIRAIWSEEVNAATNVLLGIGPTDTPPELGDAGFSDYLIKGVDAREQIESAMRRVLKIPDDQEDSSTDELSALEIAMASRAAGQLAGHGTSRAGCAAGAVVLTVVAMAMAAWFLRQRA